MKTPLHRYTFKKKADSLDISRYGLWGDSPSELLFFIVILLVISIGGLLVERKKCLDHVHPPAEYHVLSARDLYPVALAEAMTINPNAYLYSIWLTAIPIISSETPDATFWFYAEEPAQQILVTIKDSAIFTRSFSPFSVFAEKEIPADSILLDSQEALDLMIFYAHSRWGCSELQLPIRLTLLYPISSEQDHPYWRAFYPLKSAAFIELDPDASEFIVSYNK